MATKTQTHRESNQTEASGQSGYNRLLMSVAGLGGLLFGIDVGIISGALPYLEATSGLDANHLSFIVAAVLLGAALSTLFAGLLADLLGRRTLLTLSGLLFVLSVPTIALSHSYQALVAGRLLQGVSGGLIGVAAPLYLAECLAASSRGRGTAVFQWLLTLGFVAAAGIGLYFSGRVEEVARLGDAQKLFAFKDAAWRGIFWVSLPPGLLFILGSLLVSESPRWLFRRGRKAAALRALRRSRSPAQAELELREMEAVALAEQTQSAPGRRPADSLLRRKYLLPFALACIILACNQATGVNSILAYNTTILIQAGLSDHQAHLGYVLLTLVNFLATIGAVALVDRLGRKWLLSLGTGGVILALLAVGLAFRHTEQSRRDVAGQLQALVTTNQTLTFEFDPRAAASLSAATPRPPGEAPGAATLVVIYAYGDFHAASKVLRSDEPGAKLTLARDQCVPDTRVAAFFKNPFARLAVARVAPLKIEHALITPAPGAANGWLAAGLLCGFMAAFAIGPGVCVWLALSELLPTRIRSNGMSVAMLFNKIISTTIAGVFLPTVGRYGYSTLFFIFAGCTVVYFVTAAFFLPETKGKTLEEIEACFEHQPPGRL